MFKQRANKHAEPSGLKRRPKLKKLVKLSWLICAGRFNLKEIKCGYKTRLLERSVC